MSYAVALSREAADDLRRLPEALQKFIISELVLRARNPTQHSVRPGPAGRGQKFEFTFDQGGAHLYVIAYFRYGADEQTIHVFRIETEFY